MTDAKTDEAGNSAGSSAKDAEADLPPPASVPRKGQAETKPSTKLPLTIFYHWCKACNICIAYCPQKVFVPDRDGKPQIAHPEKCTQCAFCWMHCPDLAIVSNEK